MKLFHKDSVNKIKVYNNCNAIMLQNTTHSECIKEVSYHILISIPIGEG